MDSPKTPPRARPLAIEPSSPRVFFSAADTAASPESHRRIAIAVDLSDESAYAVKWVVQNYLRSKPTLTGFMGGAAVIVSLQQLKGLLGIVHFTTKMGFIPVMESVFENRGEWAWQTVVMGLSFLAFLLIARHISLRRPKLFWVSAAAPLTSVILSTIISFVFKAPNHGIKTIGHLQKGLNPPSCKYVRL